MAASGAKRFSAVNLGARTGLKHRARRSSCRARHSVERDVSCELCRRSTLRVCRGVSVTAVSISARTSLARRRFSGRGSSDAPRRRCLIFALMFSSDQSGRNARISRGFRPSTIETRNNRSRTRMTHQQQQHEQRRRPAATTQQQQCQHKTEKKDDNNTRQRRDDHNRDNGRHGEEKGREEERREREEEVKNREGRER